MVSLYTINKFEYKAPRSLGEALKLLETQGSNSRVLAGGTDLIVQMKYRQLHPSLLIDIKRIPELNRLEWSEQEGLHIGAAVSLNRLLTFTQLSEHFSILSQACSLIGSEQVRNRATMGGNICNAAPSADSIPALLCLDARALVADSSGLRAIPLENFFLAPGRTAMQSNALLVEIQIPGPPASSAGYYLRHTVREEMDIATVGVASWVVPSTSERTLKEVKIALGAVAPTPIRAYKSEASLKGKSLTPAMIDEAARQAVEESSPISDLRASAEYRREIVKVLVIRALKETCRKLGIEL